MLVKTFPKSDKSIQYQRANAGSNHRSLLRGNETTLRRRLRLHFEFWFDQRLTAPWVPVASDEGALAAGEG